MAAYLDKACRSYQFLLFMGQLHVSVRLANVCERPWFSHAVH